MKLLLKKYQEVKDQLRQVEDGLMKSGQELTEEKSKTAALQERLTKCNEEYGVVAFAVDSMKKDLRASEQKCLKLVEENQHLRENMMTKNDTEHEIEASQVQLSTISIF